MKRERWKPIYKSHRGQDALDFVPEAWAAVKEEIVARSLKGCRNSSALNGSQDGELHDWRSDISAVAPNVCEGACAVCA